MIKSDFRRHSKEEKKKKLELIFNRDHLLNIQIDYHSLFSIIFYTNEHLFYDSEIEFRRFFCYLF